MCVAATQPGDGRTGAVPLRAPTQILPDPGGHQEPVSEEDTELERENKLHKAGNTGIAVPSRLPAGVVPSVRQNSRAVRADVQNRRLHLVRAAVCEAWCS